MDGTRSGLSDLRRRLRRAPTLVVAAALVASGCGYTSQYVPPRDGRARVVWKEDDVGVNLDGIAVSPQCRAEIEMMFGGERRVAPPPASGGYYVPRYYGPNIIVIHPGLVPHFPHPPLFSPSLALARAATSSAARVAAPSAGVHVGGGGGGGGSGDAGKALAVLLVIVIVALGVIDILVSLIPPESSSVASREIDFANAFNDLARTPGSACAYDYGGPAPMMPMPGGQP